MAVVTDFPSEPAPSWPGIRDRIEAALLDAPWHQQRFDIGAESDRRALAGTLRKAFAPQLAAAREQGATVDRVRAVVRRHRHDDVIPKREIEAALYGEERA